MLAIAAILVLVGGRFGSLAHNAFVEHRVCVEHGVLEHAGEADEADEAVVVAVPPSTGMPAVLPGTGPDADDHDSCELATALREPGCDTTDAPLVADASAARAEPQRAHVDAIVSEPIYRLAPKQSPPA